MSITPIARKILQSIRRHQLFAGLTVVTVGVAAAPLSSALHDNQAALPFFGSTNTSSTNKNGVNRTIRLEATKEGSVASDGQSENSGQSSFSASSDTSTDQSASSGSVTVNGETIPVPKNGSVHKVVPSADGNTSVNIQMNNGSSSVSTHSYSSSVTTQNGQTSVQIDQHSSTSGTEDMNDDIFNSRSVPPMQR